MIYSEKTTSYHKTMKTLQHSFLAAFIGYLIGLALVSQDNSDFGRITFTIIMGGAAVLFADRINQNRIDH